MIITVRGAGEIRAKDANKIIPQLKRMAAVSFLVAEGSSVTQGEVVARFNTDEVDRRISDGETALSIAEQNVLTKQTELEIQNMESATSLKLAEQALTAARQELEKYQKGDAPLERRNAELKVTTTSSKAERSRKRYAEIKDLLAEGFVTEDQVEEERIAAETAQVEMETAKVELELLNIYTRPLKQATSENAVAKAQTELEKTRKQNEVKSSSATQAQMAALRNQERAKADLALAREELLALEVKAPADGVVTYGDPENPWRRGEIVVGANISSGQVLMTIPGMANMQAVINVPEADVHRVKREQSVTVSVEAVPGRTFPGSVAKVAEVANPGGWLGTAVKEFKIDITLSEAGDLKPGFSCDAEIVTDVIPECLYAPIQAVFREGEAYVVYREGLGAATRQIVKIGRSSTTQVELLEGVKEGERVLLAAPGEGSEEKDD
jgi:HlyD family secretion protein